MPVGSNFKTPGAGDFLLNRPLSDNGLPSGSIDLADANGSVTPVDYYVEALPGERLSIARVIVYIRAAGNISAGDYGDIAGGLANGIQIIYKRKLQDGSFVILNVSDGLPIKQNEHWGRWCYDAEPAIVGAVTPYYRVRWSFSKYGVPLFLDEGEYIGVRINDDLTSLTEHTVIAEGVHLGTPSPSWVNILT